MLQNGSLSTFGATEVYTGLNAQITTQISTRVLIAASLIPSLGTSAATLIMNLRKNTGTNNPAAGTSPVTGIILLGTQATLPANSQPPMTIAGLDTEVTVGQAYTYSTLSISAGTGGFGFIGHQFNEIFSVIEF